MKVKSEITEDYKQWLIMNDVAFDEEDLKRNKKKDNNYSFLRKLHYFPIFKSKE